MLYLQYWSSFWKSLAEITHNNEKTDSFHHLKAVSSEAIKEITPKEKYEYLTEYGTQILCLLSAETGCSYISRNFEHITGYDSEESLGLEFFDLLHTDFHPRFKQLLETPAEQSKPHHFRCKFRHSDGKYYWYMLLIHSNQQGENVCIMENVHDSIMIQNTLQKAKLEAELALRARSEFLANMSHDLRTPLNAVIGFAQIMEKEIFGKIENPQYLEYAKHIQESGYDLLSKIEDLLEIANIDAGRVSLERAEVYLSDIIKHVIQTHQHHSESAGMTVDYQPLDGEVQLYVDRLKLQHILGHLLANAIKFSQQGDKVSIISSISDNGELNLSIRDHGIGMSKKKLAGILETLAQENCWSSSDNQSIGVGLALTKEFVALHNGQLHITSKPAGGTSVHMALPPDCVRMHQSRRIDEYAQVAS